MCKNRYIGLIILITSFCSFRASHKSQMGDWTKSFASWKSIDIISEQGW